MRTTAVLTSMNHPIGMAVGNSLEVMEALTSLHGDGPEDLIELVAIQGSLSTILYYKSFVFVNCCSNKLLFRCIIAAFSG